MNVYKWPMHDYVSATVHVLLQRYLHERTLTRFPEGMLAERSVCDRKRKENRFLQKLRSAVPGYQCIYSNNIR